MEHATIQTDLVLVHAASKVKLVQKLTSAALISVKTEEHATVPMVHALVRADSKEIHVPRLTYVVQTLVRTAVLVTAMIKNVSVRLTG